MTEREGATVDLRATVGDSGGLGGGDPTFDALSALQKRKATIAARSYATGFRVGDIVTAHIRRGSYDGKTGTVVTTNLGEVGVSFTANDSVDAWFAPAELWRSV